MGWWSTEINGGDTPMDIEGCLASFMGLNQDEDADADEWLTPVSSGWLTMEVVEAFLEKETDLLDESIDHNETSILFTVLGALLMEAGAAIPEDFRKRITVHARHDTWAETSEERKVVIEEFIETLENYVDGTPTELARGSFFDLYSRDIYVAKPTCHDIWPPRPLADLMTRISAFRIDHISNPDYHSTLWQVIGYARGRLLVRDKSKEELVTESDLRSLLDSKTLKITLYEFNELRLTP
jgi:hypothetical protein